MNAVGPGLVCARCHHASSAISADDHRLSPERRITQDFDGREERIHVQVKDRARHFPTIFAVPGDRVSAIPSVGARVVAFAAIVISGLLAALIGAGFAGIGCTGDCTLIRGIGALVGAAFGAGGIAVVAVLALRAMAEWRAGPGRQLPSEETPPPRVPGGPSAGS